MWCALVAVASARCEAEQPCEGTTGTGPSPRRSVARTSGTPPTRVDTTSSPMLAASAMAMQNASVSDALTNTCAQQGGVPLSIGSCIGDHA